MHITAYKCFIVPPRWVFLKVETNEGLIGWGEPSLEGKAQTVKTATEEYMETLIGKNPLEIERHWQDIYRGGFYRGGAVMMSALSGIDQALWDIKGKYYNVPIWELIGGRVRDKMRIYSWIGGDRPEDAASAAVERMQMGFDAIKMNATAEMQYIDKYSKIDAVIRRVDAIRRATNKDFGIGIDFHGRVHKPMARILAKELEAYNPMFIEEPILSENQEEFMEIRRHCNIPIAMGERLYSRYDFKHILQSGAVDILQPDLSHAGGISEVLRIAAMAEAYDVALAPHCPLGPIALAACLQVDANRYNAVIQEQSLGIHYNQGCDILDYIKDKSVFDYKDGYMKIPQKAGLGIEIDENKVIENSRLGHNWKNPIWRHKDGSFAEW